MPNIVHYQKKSEENSSVKNFATLIGAVVGLGVIVAAPFAVIAIFSPSFAISSFSFVMNLIAVFIVTSIACVLAFGIFGGILINIFLMFHFIIDGISRRGIYHVRPGEPPLIFWNWLFLTILFILIGFWWWPGQENTLNILYWVFSKAFLAMGIGGLYVSFFSLQNKQVKSTYFVISTGLLATTLSFIFYGCPIIYDFSTKHWIDLGQTIFDVEFIATCMFISNSLSAYKETVSD